MGGVVKAGYGKVLVKPVGDTSMVIVHGKEVYIDTSFQPEKHTITCGEVVSVSDRIDDSLQTDIEVKVGDIVFCHYLSLFNAIRDDKYIVMDGNIHYPINYGSLYCAKRNGEVICLNGYILVKPIKRYNEEKIGNVYLPDSMLKQETASRGIVSYIGNPLRGETNYCKVGEEVIFRKSSSVKMQYHLHSTFGEEVYRMKSDSILATII